MRDACILIATHRTELSGAHSHTPPSTVQDMHGKSGSFPPACTYIYICLGGKTEQAWDMCKLNLTLRLSVWIKINSIRQRWSNRTRVLVLEYEYFLSTRTRVRRKVIVLVLEYITKVIVLTITSHDYIFFIWTVASKYIRQIKWQY